MTLLFLYGSESEIVLASYTPWALLSHLGINLIAILRVGACILPFRPKAISTISIN